MLGNPLLLVPFIAIAIVVGYGLLKMGRVLNLKLQEGRDRRWIVYLVGLLGGVIVVRMRIDSQYGVVAGVVGSTDCAGARHID